MNNIQTQHILIIDDSPDIQTLLKTLLESKGHSVECRSNGKDALTWLNSQRVLPDVILLDLRMPVMDGFSFLDQQRESPNLRGIRTVVMSGDTGAATRQKADPAQMLTKPLNVKSVIAAVERWTFRH